MFDDERLLQLKKYAFAVYILQALSFVLLFTALIGVIVNYVFDDDVRNVCYLSDVVAVGEIGVKTELDPCVRLTQNPCEKISVGKHSRVGRLYGQLDVPSFVIGDVDFAHPAGNDRLDLISVLYQVPGFPIRR